MTNVQLSDTQRSILTTACERRGGQVLPLAASLKGGAVRIVLKSLLSKGLIAEAPAKGKDPVWRTTEEGVPLTLTATQAAHAALGLAKGQRGRKADASANSEAKTRAPRSGTKQALLIGMLQRPKGCNSLRGGRGHGLAAPHRARRDRRRAQETARARRYR